MDQNSWQNLGPIENFNKSPLTEIEIGRTKIAISYRDGEFGAILGVCNHVGGPLGQGRLDGEYIVCPWHNWKFHYKTGVGEPGFEDDTVPSYEVRVENGHLLLRVEPLTQRHKKLHAPHPLSRPIHREEGPIRVVGISTTVMDRANPRYSTSEALLQIALDHAATDLGCEIRLIKLNDLKFRNCEGYYSKSAHACTWPYSITQMDDKDEMTEVYEALVHWGDVVMLTTPIRWGAASSLFYKMAERLNCVQNQITIRDRVLIRNKVASFIITGGQDNVQGVAGHLLGFFAEIGFCFPQFPFIAHSRGWDAEDMEQNIVDVMQSQELRDGAKELIKRSVEMAGVLLGHVHAEEKTARGGRKAHRLEVMG
ncbi:NAD(P)H-dependent oxidoreductase [candidate division KSB1 bacterium]|nr:NAD(P)H-dependent oxidoreductase [candidate division KSB1 bacterium]